MDEQANIRHQMERELAIAEAQAVAAGNKKRAPTVEARDGDGSTVNTIATEDKPAGRRGILDVLEDNAVKPVSSFFHHFADEAHRKHQQLVELRDSWAKARQEQTVPAKEVSKHSKWTAPFRAIPAVGRFMRHPFGKSNENVYKYTEVVIPYAEAAVVVIVPPVAKMLWGGVKAAGHFVTEHVAAARTASDKSYPYLNFVLKAGNLAWNYGGERLAKGLYHHLLCERLPDKRWVFSPLHAANNASFTAIIYGLTFAIPLTISAASFVGYPLYAAVSQNTYYNMDITDKADEDAGGVFKVYAVSVDEHRDIQARRQTGEDIEDEEIGKRFDVEQNYYMGIYNPIDIWGRIPRVGHCDEIHTVGWFVRSPKVQFGLYKLRARVWLAPEIISTKGCQLYSPATHDHSQLELRENYKTSAVHAFGPGSEYGAAFPGSATAAPARPAATTATPFNTASLARPYDVNLHLQHASLS